MKADQNHAYLFCHIYTKQKYPLKAATPTLYFGLSEAYPSSIGKNILIIRTSFSVARKIIYPKLLNNLKFHPHLQPERQENIK